MEAKKVIQIEKYRKHTKNKPKKRLKKKIKNFFFSLFIILIVGSVFYFTSSMSKLSMIYFDGLNYVSRSQLIEMTAGWKKLRPAVDKSNNNGGKQKWLKSD